MYLNDQILSHTSLNPAPYIWTWHTPLGLHTPAHTLYLYAPIHAYLPHGSMRTAAHVHMCTHAHIYVPICLCMHKYAGQHMSVRVGVK